MPVQCTHASTRARADCTAACQSSLAGWPERYEDLDLPTRVGYTQDLCSAGADQSH
jgi:hypothetical protein